MYMLDTNIFIYLIKDKSARLKERIRANQNKGIAISVVVYAELLYGVEKSAFKDKNRIAVEETLVPFEIVPFDENCSIAFGKIRSHLELHGKSIGPYDLLIAAHALALNATLVTNNINEFKRVPGLKFENWAK